MLEQAMESMADTYGEASPQLAWSAYRLASALESRRELERARALYETSLQIYEQVYGPEHPFVADAVNSLGNLAWVDRDYSEASSLWQRALVIREKALGQNHPDVSGSLNNLALIANIRGEYAAARSLMERSLRICETVFGPDSTKAADVLTNLAILHRTTGAFDKAQHAIERALEIYETARGENRRAVADALATLGTIHMSNQAYEKAADVLEQALETEVASYGSNNARRSTMSNLAEAYRYLGRFTEAERLLQQSIEQIRSELGGEHPSMCAHLMSLALIHTATGNREQAEGYRDRALAIWKLETNDQGGAFAAYAQARMAALAGDRTEALQQLRVAVDRGLRQYYRLDDPDFALLDGDREFEAIRRQVQQQIERRVHH